MERFGLPGLIELMREKPDLWKMGHGQNLATADIGLGWFYYGLTRSMQPSCAVVIGSWRGFVPMLIGQAMQDAGNHGSLIFIDPSYADAQWEGDVNAYFKGFGVDCISHFRKTSQDFLASNVLDRNSVDLLFIDGYHTVEQCRLEFEGFAPFLTARAITLFHDSSSKIVSNIYGEGRGYEHTVWKYIDELRCTPGFEVVNLEIDQGVAMVRRLNS